MKDDEEEEDLEELMELDLQEKPKWKTASMYAHLAHLMKGEDRKAWLDEWHKQIAAAAKSKLDDGDGDDDDQFTWFNLFGPKMF